MSKNYALGREHRKEAFRRQQKRKEATTLIVCDVCRFAWWPLCRRWSSHGRMMGQLVAPSHERKHGVGQAL